MSSETLGPNQGVQEVRCEPGGDDAEDEVGKVHDPLPLDAWRHEGVQKSGREERDHDHHVDDIEHCGLLPVAD